MPNISAQCDDAFFGIHCANYHLAPTHCIQSGVHAPTRCIQNGVHAPNGV